MVAKVRAPLDSRYGSAAAVGRRRARFRSPAPVALVAAACAACPACGAESDPPGRGVNAGLVATTLTAPGPASVRAAPSLSPRPDPSAAPADADPNENDDDVVIDPNGPKLAAIAMETYVQLGPSFHSGRLGYLRAGAVIARAAEPAGSDGCSGAW